MCPENKRLATVQGSYRSLRVPRNSRDSTSLHQEFCCTCTPLVQLTKKDQEFIFGELEQKAMRTLKHLAVNSPAIQAIDYSTDQEVILAVDSSWRAVGFALSQMGADNKHYPSCFSSILWNEREQKYSQAKIELYGLFHAL
jgi:RNase H-like domain found in reverse transcriptase